MLDKADESTAIFVYGSLLDPAHRKELIGRSVAAAPATIRGYARGRTPYYYLRKHPGTDTQGLLLTGLTAADFAPLDRYEQVPDLYTRERVEVVDEHGHAIRCWVYLPTPKLFTSTDS